MRVLLTYNLRRDDKKAEEAEFDSIETITSIRLSLERSGHEVVCLEESDNFYDDVKQIKDRVDIAFNIAEGRLGACREANVPFILELFGIPYTGSDPKTLILSLDKALCNLLLTSNGIRCPGSYIIDDDTKDRIGELTFPVIIKPNFEGSSIGISSKSVAGTYDEYVSKTALLPKGLYMAEEYITGRELTVAVHITGNEINVIKPMEVLFKEQALYNVYGFTQKKTGDTYVTFDYDPCISSNAFEQITLMAKKVVKVLAIRDLARMDFRLTTGDVPYFIEVNPLPGLAKDYSDFPNIFKFHGIGYDELISRILKSAAERMRCNYGRQ